MNYTWDQAICIAFYADYIDENVKKYKKKIEKLEYFDIFWNVSENELVFVSIYWAHSNPLGMQMI